MLPPREVLAASPAYPSQPPLPPVCPEGSVWSHPSCVPHGSQAARLPKLSLLFQSRRAPMLPLRDRVGEPGPAPNVESNSLSQLSPSDTQFYFPESLGAFSKKLTYLFVWKFSTLWLGTDTSRSFWNIPGNTLLSTSFLPPPWSLFQGDGGGVKPLPQVSPSLGPVPSHGHSWMHMARRVSTCSHHLPPHPALVPMVHLPPPPSPLQPHFSI